MRDSIGQYRRFIFSDLSERKFSTFLIITLVFLLLFIINQSDKTKGNLFFDKLLKFRVHQSRATSFVHENAYYKVNSLVAFANKFSLEQWSKRNKKIRKICRSHVISLLSLLWLSFLTLNDFSWKKKSIITLQSQCKPFALWVGVKTILNWYKITEKPIKDTLSCMKDKLNDWQVLCVPIHSACGLYQTAIEV